MSDKNEIDTLLVHFLQGQLNREEREKVKAWITGEEDHERYFQEFCRVHVHLQWMVRENAIKGDLPMFRQRLARRRRIGRYASVAAGIVLLLGVGLGLRQVVPAWMPDDGYAESVVHPGKAQAMLYLSSGVMVPIDSSGKKLTEFDGTAIEVHENGSMSYKASSREGDGAKEGMNHPVVRRKGESRLTLADGTKVWLNSESELSYPCKFTGKERVVHLKGEAYFEVAPNKACPFIVKANEADIKVYGTQFNVNTRREGIVETVLVEGTVGMKGRGKEQVLKPNQKAEYHVGDGEIRVETVDVLPYIAWRDGNFVFENESLASIMDKLSLWYDLKVFYKREDAKEVRLSGIMERYRDVNELLRFFEKSSDLKFSVRETTVFVE